MVGFHAWDTVVEISRLCLSDLLQKLVSRGARSENLERVSLSSCTAKQTEEAMLLQWVYLSRHSRKYVSDEVHIYRVRTYVAIHTVRTSRDMVVWSCIWNNWRPLFRRALLSRQKSHVYIYIYCNRKSAAKKWEVLLVWFSHYNRHRAWYQHKSPRQPECVEEGRICCSVIFALQHK